MDTKEFKALLEIKEDGEQGIVRAVFATLNVEDADGDVTLPGAFGSQNVRLGAWGHAWQALPVGKGAISEEGDQAIFDGAFFLDTDAGKEHYLTVKNLGPLQEWSYGFRVLESEASEVDGRRVRMLKKLQVYEVSPVMQGAGVDTMTVAIKGTKPTAYAAHAEQVLADVAAFIERSKERADARAQGGRVLSAADRERLLRLDDLLVEYAKEIKGLLDTTEPEKGLKLFLEYQQTLARLNGVAA